MVAKIQSDLNKRPNKIQSGVIWTAKWRTNHVLYKKEESSAHVLFLLQTAEYNPMVTPTWRLRFFRFPSQKASLAFVDRQHGLDPVDEHLQTLLQRRHLIGQSNVLHNLKRGSQWRHSILILTLGGFQRKMCYPEKFEKVISEMLFYLGNNL